MKKTLLILTSILSLSLGLRAQNNYLNWMLTAQAGTTSNINTNYHTALLWGFKNDAGQQISIGPVIKGFMSNNHIENLFGARLYSKVNLVNNIGLYMQGDLLKTNLMHPGFDGISLIKTTPKLETSMGIEFVVLNNFSLGGGYNFQEYNPVKNSKTGTMNLRAVFNFSLSGKNY